MGSLSCVSPTTSYIYKVIQINSSVTIASGQLWGWLIQHVAEIFLQVMIPSIPARTKGGANHQYSPTQSFLCIYIHNWIWSFQQARGALEMQISFEIQGILGDAAILHIIFLWTSRKTRWRRCSMQHIRIIDFICSKLFVIVTSS